jgi:Putative esterase/Secretion system C-terminal sorting domain
MRIFLGVVAVVALVVTLLIEWPGVSHGGTLLEETFFGPITQRTVHYNIYLPDGYENGNEHYPVIYHLHGLGGNQGGGQNTVVPQSFEAARQSGVIGPVIVVFPNGYVDSFWADSWDGAKPAETNVALELVPHVDANYRTIAHRGGRVIEGFSMGAFGAAKFAAKFSHLFRVCVLYDGAFLTWPNLVQYHPSIAQGIFHGDESYFDLFSPWQQMEEHAAEVRVGVAVRQVAGSLLAGNRAFRDHLLSLDIPLPYVETGCGHVLGCLFDAQGMQSAAFIAAALAGSAGVDDDGSEAEPELEVGSAVAQLYLAAAPNPARDRARIHFDVPSAERSSLAVFDVLGRERLRVLDGTALPSGRHELELDLRGLAAGSYFCRLVSGGEARTIKLAVSR